MSDCDHQCGSCSESCGDRSEPQQDFRVKPHAKSRIGKVIGVVSGKGGVGKSLVTSLLAVALTRQGKHCAILDADITGPSIPRIFGLSGKAHVEGDGLMPERSKGGVDIMSMNLLLPGDSDAVLWRQRRQIDDFLVIKVGTGIGCGIVCHGELYRGSTGSAGDIGHICADPEGPLCRCGNRGCVEAMAAAPAIVAMGMEAARSIRISRSTSSSSAAVCTARP